MQVGVTLFGRRLEFTATPVPRGRGAGSWVTVREPYTGAWQRNDEIRGETVLSNHAVFACIDLISRDIAKMRFRLVAEKDGIWTETTSSAFSPVLRKPNRYQTFKKFVEQWISSKLVYGNSYALKERDERGVVRAQYLLDPRYVTTLVAPDGSVYYSLEKPQELAGVSQANGIDLPVVVPAREMIHDLMIPLFHPLMGVSPIFACATAAMQGIHIQNNSAMFFANASQPGGLLITPAEISDETAQKIKEDWQAAFSGEKMGKIGVIGSGLKYEPLAITPHDAQLIEQLRWSTETVCSCFHVPIFMIDTSKTPPYANAEPLVNQYYSQCIQSLAADFEMAQDEGLELPPPYGTEFDIDDLIWMDTATKTKAAHEAISSGAVSPNEARKKYFGLGPVPGGSTPYLQQQMYSLEALAKRDAENPLGKPPAPEPKPEPEDEDEAEDGEPEDGDPDDDEDNGGGKALELDYAAVLVALEKEMSSLHVA